MSVKNNKEAWEFKVYEWRTQFQGAPKEVAEGIIKNPREFLMFHSEFFTNIENEKIASICGSDGRRALALAALGARPTVFDISEPQKKYALEMADSVGLHIDYELGDFNSVDLSKYYKFFDKLYCEGGILHYFHDLDIFFRNCYNIINHKGIFVLSDFHPFRKAIYVKEQKKILKKQMGIILIQKYMMVMYLTQNISPMKFSSNFQFAN